MRSLKNLKSLKEIDVEQWERECVIPGGDVVISENHLNYILFCAGAVDIYTKEKERKKCKTTLERVEQLLKILTKRQQKGTNFTLNIDFYNDYGGYVIFNGLNAWALWEVLEYLTDLKEFILTHKEETK